MNDRDDIYQPIQEYNQHKERNVLILFDDMIADMFTKEEFNRLITWLFMEVIA